MSTSHDGSQREASRELAPEDFVRASLPRLGSRAKQLAQGPNMHGWDEEDEALWALAQVVSRFEDLKNPMAYALIALRNSASSHLRKKQKLREVPIGGTTEAEDYLVHVANGASAIEHLEYTFSKPLVAALLTLPPERREVVVLDSYGFETGEIATRLRLKDGTVRQHRRRALKALNAILKKDSGEQPALSFPTDPAEVL
ncbi:sigma-70 family RNA polymerase sigma factor [Streptomyces olivaceus]|uniref:sigma-70 family RNA polymerase sigma factor n=1 Tax=Streptomyces olivaceus TaxID=47716 RepID=UPI001CCAB3AF|nr:sigma-70 family RNA polymerase sigma factor [Streptomyces olivaceus]MBZ6134430.1 sigma-70 family RNA polymerase sigma factor [Streptomyces olivaceus]